MKHQLTHRSKLTLNQKLPGFTIVELLIVIVVIGILAAISIIAYNGISTQAAEASLQSDLTNASKQLGMIHAEEGSYPSSIPSSVKFTNSNTPHYSQTNSGTGYCLTATSSNSSAKAYYISSTTGTVAEATTSNNCPGHPTGSGNGGSGGESGSGDPITHGAIIQTITSANCPTDRTRAVDARDNRTYWVQKMADGKCWMLTNLAYAGGGLNTYGDIMEMDKGGSSATTPSYHEPSTTGWTTEPNNPSISIYGTGQYGYLYNWCAAMGNQTGTAACLPSLTPTPDTTLSICASGWRLPSPSEYIVLNESVNSGLSSTDDGLLTEWLGQRSGLWTGTSFSSRATAALYWTSAQSDSYDSALSFMFGNTYVVPPGGMGTHKWYGISVRCVAR